MTDIALFPQPQQLERAPGQFILDADTRIAADDIKLGELLADYLRPATGFDLPVDQLGQRPVGDNSIQLLPNSGDDESYTLGRIAATGHHFRGPRAAGFIRGMQTLRQLLPPQILGAESVDQAEWTIPALSITDAPTFGWRGLHLDVGRHLFPVEFIKKVHRPAVLLQIQHLPLASHRGPRLAHRNQEISQAD